MNDWREKQRGGIVKQLRKLRSTRSALEPFVVITDPKTGKFVQFVGSTQQELLLDLSTAQLLSDKELRLARRLLGQPRTIKMGPRSPKALVLFRAGPFEKVEKATDLALDVMEKVFRAKGNELRVEFSQKSEEAN